MSFASEIAKKINQGEMRPPDNLEIIHVMALSALESQSDEIQTEYINDELETRRDLNMLVNRMKAVFPVGTECTPSLMLFLADHAQTPGQILLFLAVMHEMHESGTPLSLTSLLTTRWQRGLPTKENLDQAWDAQKLTMHVRARIKVDSIFGDNALDLEESWK